MNGIVKSLALELAPHGVRVNSVCPADVETPMLAGQARDYGGGDEAGYLAALKATLPQGERARFIRADEIAAARGVPGFRPGRADHRRLPARRMGRHGRVLTRRFRGSDLRRC